jgi:HD-GYP domain-containing protein (c-di-GMP phosphodiesterase class II)
VRIAVEILAPLTSLARVLPAIQDHHERYDGSGYPRQLAGEQISLGGRILAAADAYDALTSRRSYREPLASEESIALLASDVGSHLDAAVFEVLSQVVLPLRGTHETSERSTDESRRRV